jgi:hypothetical protein
LLTCLHVEANINHNNFRFGEDRIVRHRVKVANLKGDTRGALQVAIHIREGEAASVEGVNPLASGIIGQVDANDPIQRVSRRVASGGNRNGVCRPDETEPLDTDSRKLVTSLDNFPFQSDWSACPHQYGFY